MRHHKEQSRELLTPRVATELIFDQSLGDIFSIRLAGNVASPEAIASLEYTCKVLGLS